MSILDKLKEPPGADGSRRNNPTRPRLPEAVSAPREIARIGNTIRIRGNVTGAENLVIDCRIEGNVSLAGHDITIGQTGHVSAGVTANLVRVEGEVTGNITGTEKVVVTRTGRVLGNIVAPRVTLEDGAKFKGAIDMDPSPAAPEPEPGTLRSMPGSPSPLKQGH